MNALYNCMLNLTQGLPSILKLVGFFFVLANIKFCIDGALCDKEHNMEIVHRFHPMNEKDHYSRSGCNPLITVPSITQTRLCNILQYFTAVKMMIFR